MVNNNSRINLPEGGDGYLCYIIGNSDKVKTSALALASIVKSITGKTPAFIFKDLEKLSKENCLIIGLDKDLKPLLRCAKKAIFCPISETVQEDDFTWQDPGRPLSYCFTKVGFSEAPDGMLDPNQQIIRSGDSLWIKPQLLQDYFSQLMAHFSGEIEPNRVCAIIRYFRVIFQQIWGLANGPNLKPVTLFTIDSEDQHSYYDNKSAKCTDISGQTEDLDDMRFDQAVTTSTDRLLTLGVHPTFMVTGSELSKEGVDAFGNKLNSPEKNIHLLQRLSQRGEISIAMHSYDHERWLNFGSAQHKPMKFLSKLSYFFDAGGTLPILSRLIVWTLCHKVEKPKLGEGGEFTERELAFQIDNLEQLLKDNQINFRKFHRHPGFRRSAVVVRYLNERGYCDSSDVLNIENLSPPVPYYLFCLNGEELFLSDLLEFPCLFVDEYLRTRSKSKLKLLLTYLSAIFQYNETILTIVSHTKVVGGNLSHNHVYPRNPISGFSQPMRMSNLIDISKILSDSRSLSFAEYEKGLR